MNYTYREKESCFVNIRYLSPTNYFGTVFSIRLTIDGCHSPNYYAWIKPRP